MKDISNANDIKCYDGKVVKKVNNHQHPQYSIYTAWVVLNAQLELLSMLYHKPAVKDRLQILFIKREPMLSGFSQSKCLEHLGTAGNKELFDVMGKKRLV